jgi:hypothetical protein
MELCSINRNDYESEPNITELVIFPVNFHVLEVDHYVCGQFSSFISSLSDSLLSDSSLKVSMQ